ncbi:hypothetical protein XENTR_v10012978 [Xenopus tropicalis]|uniref:Transmembrane protein 40 n=1 Tax=Xenopus tropicalis TaxID=8364 RepID=A0A6I8QP65_XENTR|nr:transmembrane protein 40 [Xenopus tropicalis]KAE8612765.1 hypothetical protein XENTR_v10012978 [Xenopus tropicalis]KAE8612766.1 hypothetical protein XENTR_v10012978 [Xenopus tropicalis]|eukprot:XP_002943537.1 PREDICTED: transmembrane protein 40 [Xenopus tropicalis]
MEAGHFQIPNLSPDQQEIFRKAFSQDLEKLKSDEGLGAPSWDLFINLCKAPALSILTQEEAQTLLQLAPPSQQRDAVLKSIEEKGPSAIFILYLFLNLHNEERYGEMPSSTDNDEKLGIISTVRDNFLLVLRKKVMELAQRSRLSAPQGGVRPGSAVATVKPMAPNKESPQGKSQEDPESTDDIIKEEKKEIHPVTERSREKDKKKKEMEKHHVADTVDGPRHRNRKYWGIRKDDEFFHFIIICFAVGASLISSYNYSDWTVSAGIGLLAFASLETIGIYFGLVYRIRTVIEAFLPLLRKSPLASLQKEQ